MNRLLALAAFAAGLFMLACSGDDSDTHAPSNLSQAEIDDLHELADEQPADGILTPAIPLYIPAGLYYSPGPPIGTSDGVTLLFGGAPRGSSPGSNPTALSLVLSQGSSGGTVLYEPPFVDLNGIQASEESVSDHTTAHYSLSFDFGERDFFLSVEWDSPDGTVTEEMKRETILLAESIMADARDRGLVNLDE